jgi:hypothetical protein
LRIEKAKSAILDFMSMEKSYLEELFPIRVFVGSYLRIGGTFKGLGNTVSLYRCAGQ